MSTRRPPAVSAAARSMYVRAARAADPVLRRIGGPDGADPDARVRHWLSSLGSAYDAEGLVRLGVPWWTYRSIEFVDAWLMARSRPRRVLEYGSGASTVWLAARAEEVHSVEHDAEFAGVVASLTAGLDNVSLHVVAPVASASPSIPSGRPEFSGLDFAEYVAAGPGLGGEFDLVVIDGRARAACLSAVAAMVATGGLVVFDNSARRRYRAAIDSCGSTERRLRGLAPTLPYPDQTSVLTRHG